jgi:hypothetical protein
VDDWGPLMAQMPTTQRNYIKKHTKYWISRNAICMTNEALDKIESEASQL